MKPPFAAEFRTRLQAKTAVWKREKTAKADGGKDAASERAAFPGNAVPAAAFLPDREEKEQEALELVAIDSMLLPGISVLH